MTVHVLGTEGCRTMGDALRDLDARALIRSHFILMAGDTITNAKLLTVLDKHKKNCKYDKGLAMTVVFKRACTKLRSGDEVVIAKDPQTNRLFHHQRLNPLSNEKKLSFPLELFTEQSSLVLEHDLIDPQIAICSPAALPLFSDNFDFLTRDDFLTGVLINEEMLDSRIYCEELPADEYAARCSNWQSYKRVSNDIINRWAYPLVPEMGICELRQKFVFYRNNIYRSSQNTTLARTSLLKENVVIAESEVAEGTVISHSVIGRGCRIGKNCQLRNVFIMDHVKIGDNCQLSNCVIGPEVVVGNHCKISECGILGEGVELPEKTTIQKIVVQSTKPADDYDEFEEIGPKAFIVKHDGGDADADGLDSDEEDDQDAHKVPSLINRMASLDNIYESSVYSSDSDDDDEDDKQNFAQEDGHIFLGEVIESIKRGYEKKNNPDFLILEINSSRYAYNMSLNEVNFYVVKAIFNLPSLENADEAEYLKEFKRIYTYMSSVLKNYIRGAEAMTDCLKAVYDCCVTGHEVLKKKISQILCLFYNEDILADTVILKWYDGLMTEDEEKVDWAQKELEKFIEWLQEEEEESSEEDNDDESD